LHFARQSQSIFFAVDIIAYICTVLCYRIPGRSGKIIKTKGKQQQKVDLQKLHLLQAVNLAKPDRIVPQRPNVWTYAPEMGSDFINKAGIQSGVMHFDFVQKWSNEINQLGNCLILFNLIQYYLTL